MVRDEIESFAKNFIDQFASFDVKLILRLTQARFELLNEIGRGNDFDAGAAHQFNSARINQRDVGYGAVGRILHSNPLCAIEQEMKFLLLLGPTGIAILGAGKRIKGAAFDAMHQLARFTIRTQKIIPAARGLQVVGKTQNAIGEGIAAMVVKEEPTVEVCLAERSLDQFKLHLFGF